MTTLGKTQSQETKDKISATMKGRKRAPKPAEPEREPWPPQAPGRPYDQRKGQEL